MKKRGLWHSQKITFRVSRGAPMPHSTQSNALKTNNGAVALIDYSAVAVALFYIKVIFLSTPTNKKFYKICMRSRITASNLKLQIQTYNVFYYIPNL